MQGRPPSAEPHDETGALPPVVDDPGNEALWDLAAANSRAADLLASGHPKDAVPLFQRVLERCRELVGERHHATLTVAGNLGVATLVAGKRRPGLALIRANVADRVRAWGEEDTRTLIARDALAVAHRLAGDVDEAAQLSQQVTAQRFRILGATDPATLTSRMGLVQARAATGNLDSAGSLLTSALADAERAHGSRHPSTVALLECGEHLGLLRAAH